MMAVGQGILCALLLSTLAVVAADQDCAYVLYSSPVYSSPLSQYGRPMAAEYSVHPFYRYLNPYGPPLRSFPPTPMVLALRNPPQQPPASQSEPPEKENPFVESPILHKPYSNTAVVGVIDGAAVPSGELPGHVVFVQTWTPICGGTLITSTRVLTSAACAVFIQSDQTNVRAYINTVTMAPLDSRTEIRSVSSIVTHPDYGMGPSSKVLQNDIAVVTVDFAVRGVRRVRLSGFYDNYVGDTLEAYGFGYTSPVLVSPLMGLQTPQAVFENAPPARQTTSNFLTKGLGTVLANSDCADLFGASELTDSQYLCIATSNNFCTGDVGSPLMKNGVQYGIASVNALACSLDYPAVYMRVKYFKDWIISVID